MYLYLVAVLIACNRADPPAAKSEHAGMAMGKQEPNGGEASPASEHAGMAMGGGDEDGASKPGVEVSADVARALDIRTEPAGGATVSVERRAPASVGWDPLEVTRLSAQPGGQIRELALPRVGERVRAGQVVARLYSPEVRAAFEELRVATGLGEPWISAAKSRLVAIGVSSRDVEGARTGVAPPVYTLQAPKAGVVLQRLAIEGDWLAPGGAIAVIGDSSDLVVDMVVTGPAPAPDTVITLRDTTSGATWTAAVASVLPTADAAGTQVRLVPATPPPVGRPLVAEWTDAPSEGGVWVPESALVDTGERRVVFVESSPGRFEPRQVKVGATADQKVQILDGVVSGEKVVVSGTFLLDSETQIGASGHAAHGG